MFGSYLLITLHNWNRTVCMCIPKMHHYILLLKIQYWFQNIRICVLRYQKQKYVTADMLVVAKQMSLGEEHHIFYGSTNFML